MKNKYLLVGTVTTAVFASIAILNPFSSEDGEGTYSPRKSSKLDSQRKSANDAMEYMRTLRLIHLLEKLMEKRLRELELKRSRTREQG